MKKALNCVGCMERTRRVAYLSQAADGVADGGDGWPPSSVQGMLHIANVTGGGSRQL